MDTAMTHISLEWRELPALADAPSEPGVYAVWDDQYIHGRDVLVYLGQAADLKTRPDPQPTSHHRQQISLVQSTPKAQWLSD